MPSKPLPPNPQLFLVNCANCGSETIGTSTPEHVANFESQQRPHLRRWGGRIKSRPYCAVCIQPSPPVFGRAEPDGGTSPGWENAVRALEG